MTAPTATDRLTDRIAAALRRHFHGPLYAPYSALGHDELPFACNVCWIAAEIAAREVTR